MLYKISCKECVYEKRNKYRSEKIVKLKSENQEEYKKDRAEKNEKLKQWRKTQQKELTPLEKLKKKIYRYLCKIPKLKGDAQEMKEFFQFNNYDDLVEWIEIQFSPDMNWENYGKLWCFDHINPLSNFDLENEAEYRKCNHFSNIQPIKNDENCRKNSKVLEDLIQQK